MLSLLFLICCTSNARAVDVYMGGYGPRLGVHVAPDVMPLRIGGEGSLYWNRHLRSGFMVDLGLDARRVNATALVVTEYVGPIGSVAFTAGGGLGYGHDWYWDGRGARRSVHGLPIRITGGFLVRDGPREVHLRLVGEWRAPVSEQLRGELSVTPELGRGRALGLFVEVAVLFGDFTPRRKPSMFDGQPLPVDDL